MLDELATPPADAPQEAADGSGGDEGPSGSLGIGSLR
jgi:hypothetical protein